MQTCITMFVATADHGTISIPRLQDEITLKQGIHT